ncbi:hypothetical protein FSP39_005206 [Pinctada imbricata]|uniref:Uncharacterized protein n=1 Tax=Pinctada imbricata TaxID=66713 RepID=A0AA88YH82_PINIB|nr:hypothetical protein FSP39_005206 [Pinctada imbricata]
MYVITRGVRLTFREDRWTGPVFSKEVWTGPVMESRRHSDNGTMLYQPLQWIRTKGKGGTELLILKRKLLKTISVSTATFGIKIDDVIVNVTDKPRGCLSKLNGQEYETLVRDFLLHNFRGPKERRGIVNGKKEKEASLGENERICNMRLNPHNIDHLTSYYECCQLRDEEIKCKKLVIEFLLSILVVCLNLFEFIALMFAPMVIPKSYFKEKFRTYVYEHYLKVPVSILAKKDSIRHPEKETDYTVSVSKMCPDVMPKFGNTLNKMKEGSIYKLQLSKIEFYVKSGQLVTKSKSPISLLNSMYESLVLCKIRKKTSVMKCCKANMFGGKRCVCNRVQLTWYQCLRGLMNLLFMLMLCLPWVARTMVIYNYEREDITTNNTYQRTGWIIQSSYRLSYVSPLHVAFLICYIFLLCEGVLLGYISKHVTRMLRMVIRKCFQDMKNTSRAHVIGWFFRLLLKPLTHFGLCGMFILPFHFVVVTPFALVVMTMYFLPTFNIVMRLILYSLFHSVLKSNLKIVKYRQGTTYCQFLFSFFDFEYLLGREYLMKENSVPKIKSRVIQIPVAVISLVCVLSFTLLAMEFLVFFFEYIMLTMIGIILNATFAMEYVSILVMVIVYGKECFSGVTQKYSSFNSDIHEFVLDKLRKEMKVIAAQDEAEQNNTAFVLPLPSMASSNLNILIEDEISIDDEPLKKEVAQNSKSIDDFVREKDGNMSSEPTFVVKDGIPKWKTRQLIFFLDRKDTTCITEKFFFQTVNMPHSGGPGNLPSNVISALAQFLVTLVFLLFVILIVMIFGSQYNVSDLNQIIATLLTGFLPLLIADLTVDKMEEVLDGEMKEADEKIKESGSEEDISKNDERVDCDKENGDKNDDHVNDIDLVININRHSHKVFHVV